MKLYDYIKSKICICFWKTIQTMSSIINDLDKLFKGIQNLPSEHLCHEHIQQGKIVIHQHLPVILQLLVDLPN